MEVGVSGVLVLSGLVNFSTVCWPSSNLSLQRHNLGGAWESAVRDAVKDRTSFKLPLSRTCWVGAVLT
jgi:hypothetical protein